VCRGWRAALSERALWTRLDVSRTSGVTTRVADALLRGAAARAGGELQRLDVSGRPAVSRKALLAVATANAATLRELRVCHGVRSRLTVIDTSLLTVGNAEALLRAVPQLRVLDADVDCGSVADAQRALRAEGSLTPLRVHGLLLQTNATAATEADLLALAGDIASHASLQELCLSANLGTQAALDAVVDASLQRRLAAVYFMSCGLSPALVPALARLLGGGALTDLFV
jgi:hypothetical protein